jgi:hypothetical protein
VTTIADDCNILNLLEQIEALRHLQKKRGPAAKFDDEAEDALPDESSDDEVNPDDTLDREDLEALLETEAFTEMEMEEDWDYWDFDA